MPYVRKKGNQAVVVHGERDSVSKKVQQKTLFVFYSKAEALSAIGESSHWFQQTLLDEFPGIRKRLEKFIQEGRLAYQEDVQHGFENAPNTLQRLFSGANKGKQLLKL